MIDFSFGILSCNRYIKSFFKKSRISIPITPKNNLNQCRDYLTVLFFNN